MTEQPSSHPVTKLSLHFGEATAFFNSPNGITTPRTEVERVTQFFGLELGPAIETFMIEYIPGSQEWTVTLIQRVRDESYIDTQIICIRANNTGKVTQVAKWRSGDRNVDPRVLAEVVQDMKSLELTTGQPIDYERFMHGIYHFTAIRVVWSDPELNIRALYGMASRLSLS